MEDSAEGSLAGVEPTPRSLRTQRRLMGGWSVEETVWAFIDAWGAKCFLHKD